MYEIQKNNAYFLLGIFGKEMVTAKQLFFSTDF